MEYTCPVSGCISAGSLTMEYQTLRTKSVLRAVLNLAFQMIMKALPTKSGAQIGLALGTNG